jgi:teichuronic acid biosynthesis protein TuaE
VSTQVTTSGMPRGQLIQTVAHLALWVLAASALYGGYLVLPGLHGHSLYSILAKILIVPLPLAALYFWWKLRPPAAWALLVFTVWLLWVLISFVSHHHRTYYIEYYVWSQINGWGILLALWLLGRHPAWIRSFWQIGLPLYWLATILVAFWEIHTGHHLGTSAVPGKHIPTAFFFNPNDLGAALALLLPFMWFWYEVVPGEWGKLGSVLWTVVSLWLLVKTGSRGGELALILDLVALPVVLPKKARGWAIAALAAGLALLAGLIAWARSLGPLYKLPRDLSKLARIPDLFTTYIPQHLGPHVAPGSVGIRWHLYESGMIALSRHPLGLGPHGAELWYRYWVHHQGLINTYGITNAHNLWLEVAMDFGWPGIILFVTAFVTLLVYAYRNAHSSDGLKRALGRAGFPALIGFVLGSLSPSSVMIGFEVMWVVFGLLLAAERLPEVQQPYRRVFQEAD